MAAQALFEAYRQIRKRLTEKKQKLSNFASFVFRIPKAVNDAAHQLPKNLQEMQDGIGAVAEYAMGKVKDAAEAVRNVDVNAVTGKLQEAAKAAVDGVTAVANIGAPAPRDEMAEQARDLPRPPSVRRALLLWHPSSEPAYCGSKERVPGVP